MSKKEKPNILFVVVDGLREDRVFSKNRTTKTPTIDKLRNSGSYFSQVISTSDVTGTGMGCFFSGVYPFESGITESKIDSKLFTLINIFKKNGYSMHGSGPNFKFFKNLSSFLNDSFYYDYQKWREIDTILGKSGNDVINHIKSIQEEPWFYYLHLMDIHGMGKLIKIPSEFDNDNFGKTKYDRMISCIDFWLDKLLKQINLDNTIIIITADHGEYVSSKIDDPMGIPNVYKFLRKMKKIIPILEPIGNQIFNILLKTNAKLKRSILSIQFDSKEMRDILTRGNTDELFDDVLKIPLIFSGNKIKPSKKISVLIRQIDVLPTILDIIGIEYSEKIQGRSLVPILNGDKLEEIPVYIETGNAEHDNVGNTIGVRTSKYKYLRNRYDKNLDIRLFSIIDDPLELKNLGKIKPEVVDKLESNLKQIMENKTIFQKEELTDEDRMIQEELKKMGYL